MRISGEKVCDYVFFFRFVPNDSFAAPFLGTILFRIYAFYVTVLRQNHYRFLFRD